jgi:hypothetical protein
MIPILKKVVIMIVDMLLMVLQIGPVKQKE